MAEKNEVAKKQEFTTGLSQWTNTITGLVSRDFEQNGVQYDEYSKQCAMNAMSAIYQLVQNTDKADMNNLNTSNLREVVAQCASLKLNANAMPREVFFQLRSKQINGQWVKMVEMGIEGDGNDSLLRQFGNNVDTVYPVWLVKEGDDFNGLVGEVDGVYFVKAPKSYFPEKVHFIITNPIVMPSPIKLAEYKIHDDAPGISGYLVEGRVRYDAFVLNKKKDAIGVCEDPAE